MSDEAMREALRDARATFYMSELEGFGIPPIESLWAGCPAVVHKALPSVAALPCGGQIRLDSISRESVAASLAKLEDDAALSRLSEETAGLDLPTWQAAMQRLASWVVG